jgi:hypothetical protein
VTTPAVHADLAALIALAVADEQRSAVGIEVGFIKRERFADPQPGAPEHNDDAAQPDTVGTISGSAHHGDDLLDARWVRWIPNPLCCAAQPLGGNWTWSPASGGARRDLATGWTP